jgi:hypothetical protein
MQILLVRHCHRPIPIWDPKLHIESPMFMQRFEGELRDRLFHSLLELYVPSFGLAAVVCLVLVIVVVIVVGFPAVETIDCHFRVSISICV